jgi:hypothetical protein
VLVVETGTRGATVEHIYCAKHFECCCCYYFYVLSLVFFSLVFVYVYMYQCLNVIGSLLLANTVIKELN